MDNERLNRTEHYDVVIVGAGITGLTAAYRLSKETGLRVALAEKTNQVGGVIQSAQQSGYHLEFAANTFLPSATAVLKLCHELNLEPTKASARAKKRYIFYQGQLVPVPMDPLSLLTTSLLSPAGKIKLLIEPFCPPGIPKNETVAEFTRRRLGQEVLDYLMGPFLSGVYAGDPEKLSLKAVFPKLASWEESSGGLLKGAFKSLLDKSGNVKEQPKKKKKDRRMLSFSQGMAELPQALASQLPVDVLRLNSDLVQIEKNKLNYCLNFSSGACWQTRSLIFTAPAHVGSGLFAASEPKLAQVLGKIPYAPMAIVHLGFNQSDLPHELDGFGFLVPRKSGVQTLGAIWSSCLYPDRAPEGKELFTCFLGGALQTEVSTWTEEKIREQVLMDMGQMMGFPASVIPDFAHVKLWPQAIPQYELEHLEYSQYLQSHCPENLTFAGNFRSGVSVNDCVLQGELAAQSVLKKQVKVSF